MSVQVCDCPQVAIADGLVLLRCGELYAIASCERADLRFVDGYAFQPGRIVGYDVRLVELAPAKVSSPLLAATCRAVLGQCDFSLHIVGETGAFKSKLAALYQQHFGSGMDRLHLPGNWSSTANALEPLCFHAKDVLFTIDDFAPQGSNGDVAKYHATAERIIRAAGNQSGRGRLDSTAKLLEPKPSRALILPTGEDIPRGHSIRARMLTLELSKGEISSPKLTVCQHDGRSGLYARTMAGYIQWIASSYEHIQTSFEKRFAALRNITHHSSAHARTPDIVANLQAGFEIFLEFATSVRASDSKAHDDLTQRCWKALQQAHWRRPSIRCPLSLLIDFSICFARRSRQRWPIWLTDTVTISPTIAPASCGWRRAQQSAPWTPDGDCIGWLDGEDLYLEPVAAFRVAQNIGRDIGESTPVTEQTLKKRLGPKGPASIA